MISKLQCLLVCVLWSGVWVSPGSTSVSTDGEIWMSACGNEDYDPSSQCCCDMTVNDVPEHDCQCCGKVAYRWHQTKPDDCLNVCGTQRFHRDTQLCCDGGTVFNATSYSHICCGSQAIDTNTHSCCGGRFPVDKKNYKCCARMLPFHIPTMRCHRKSGEPMTSLKRKQRFRTQELCQLDLPVFDVTWPAPHLRNNSHTHIRAIPETCKITVKTKDDSSGVTKITIPFSSFAVVGRHPDPDCLKTSVSLELVVKVGPGQPCAGEEELQAYFHGQVVDVLVKKDLVCLKTPVRGGLRLKEGDNAVLFLAGSAQPVMEQSLRPRP